MLYQIFKSKHKPHITMSQTPNTCKEYSDIDYLIYIINWSQKMSLPPHILYLQYGFMFPIYGKNYIFPIYGKNTRNARYQISYVRKQRHVL